jgi:hypothetical protein
MDGNELIHVGQAVTAATRHLLVANPHKVFELECELIADLLDRPRLDVIFKVVRKVKHLLLKQLHPMH